MGGRGLTFRRRQPPAAPAVGGGSDPVSDIATWFASYWADGDEMDALAYADGAPVDAWPDETGTNDLANATAAEQPLFVAAHADFNQRAAVESDDTDDHLDSPDFADLAQPNAVALVAKLDTDTGLTQVFFDAAPVDSSGRNAIMKTDATQPDGLSDSWTIHAGSNVDGQEADQDAHLFVATFDGASSTLEVDGDLVVSGDAGAAALSSIRLFHNFSDTTLRPLSGAIAFAAVKDGKLTTQELADLETWAAEFYGLTIS